MAPNRRQVNDRNWRKVAGTESCPNRQEWAAFQTLELRPISASIRYENTNLASQREPRLSAADNCKLSMRNREPNFELCYQLHAAVVEMAEDDAVIVADGARGLAAAAGTRVRAARMKDAPGRR